MLKIKEIYNYLETVAPPALQESYDNAGLIVGNPEAEVSSVLVTIDVTEDVVVEAIEKKAGLIIAHHPIVFSGLKKINRQKLCGTNGAESH
jgi:putative NIF3 family GTP cyclohydrolase 1 type 2